MKENDIALRSIHYASVSGDSKNSYVWEGNIPEELEDGTYDAKIILQQLLED